MFQYWRHWLLLFSIHDHLPSGAVINIFLKAPFLSTSLSFNCCIQVKFQMKVPLTLVQAVEILTVLEFVIITIALYMLPYFTKRILKFCNRRSGGTLSQDAIWKLRILIQCFGYCLAVLAAIGVMVVESRLPADIFKECNWWYQIKELHQLRWILDKVSGKFNNHPKIKWEKSTVHGDLNRLDVVYQSLHSGTNSGIRSTPKKNFFNPRAVRRQTANGKLVLVRYTSELYSGILVVNTGHVYPHIHLETAWIVYSYFII